MSNRKTQEKNAMKPAQNEPKTKAKEDQAPEETTVFATEKAAAFAAEMLEKHGLKTESIKGTGKDGAITKGDIEGAVKSVEDDSVEDAPAPAQKETKAVKGDELKEILDRMISFSLPIRGALNTKPRVQAEWNALCERAIKYRKSLK